MRAIIWFTVLGAITWTAACGGGEDDGGPALDRDAGGASGAGQGAPAGSGGGAGVTAGTGGAGASGSGDQVMDRCLDADCTPSRLPPQPELEFLEDMGDGWQRLMEADWELAPESEGYRCMRLTIPRDVYIVAFAPQSPLGTHHATFGVMETPNGPDGVVACGVGAPGERHLQGSGAGTEPSELPPGVAMPLRRGEQVIMNLHLFNVSSQPLRGRSGMWVKTVPADQVQFEAENVLAGPLGLRIPIGRSTQTGGCTLRADATIYAVGPHMHQKGVHLRAVAKTAAGEVTLHDGDYDFSHQVVYAIDPVEVRAGDRVELECTYENDTDRVINWGDSSLDEMCFMSLNLYPAIGYGSGPCWN